MPPTTIDRAPLNPRFRAELEGAVAKMQRDPDLDHVGFVLSYVVDRMFAAETALQSVRRYEDRVWDLEGAVQLDAERFRDLYDKAERAERLEGTVAALEARLSRFERGVELAKEAPVWPAEPRVLVKNGKPVEHERNTQVAEPLRAVVNGLALPF